MQHARKLQQGEGKREKERGKGRENIRKIQDNVGEQDHDGQSGAEEHQHPRALVEKDVILPLHLFLLICKL